MAFVPILSLRAKIPADAGRKAGGAREPRLLVRGKAGNAPIRLGSVNAAAKEVDACSPRACLARGTSKLRVGRHWPEARTPVPRSRHLRLLHASSACRDVLQGYSDFETLPNKRNLVMKKTQGLLVLSLAALFGCGTLVDESKPSVPAKIVAPSAPQAWEKTAVAELTNWLYQVTAAGRVRVDGKDGIVFHVGNVVSLHARTYEVHIEADNVRLVVFLTYLHFVLRSYAKILVAISIEWNEIKVETFIC